MGKFLYLSWQEDYQDSFDESGDPQRFGNFGDYFINVIEGCGLRVSEHSRSLLDGGVGGVLPEELRKSQVSDRIMKLTTDESSLKHAGRRLLRIYLQMMTLELSWAEYMEAISDVMSEKVVPELGRALKCLREMLEHY